MKTTINKTYSEMFPVGSRVYHDTLGYGTVVDSKTVNPNNPLEDYAVCVQFDNLKTFRNITNKHTEHEPLQMVEAATTSKPETIHAIITTIGPKSNMIRTPVKLTLGDHRVRFHSVDHHKIDLEIVGPVSVKPFISYLYDLEKKPCEIVNVKSFLRLSVHVPNARYESVRLNYVIRYDVKRQTGKGAYTIEEKEKLFLTDADRETVIRYGDRYVERFRDGNTHETASEFIQWFQDWAHPLTLEEVTASLTDDQKRKAAKLLQAMFTA